MAVAAGTRFGPYEIISPLGAGGMGEVYRARDKRLGRDVAVKILPSTFSADPDRLQRFEQEACAAGALNHPNILSIHDIGTQDGSPYVVSELLEGETLRERMTGVALPQRKAIDYALQIARGLAAAHEKGIVHRDLKPENLFITNDGRLKILDFGLAKLTGGLDRSQSQTDVPTRRVHTDPGTVMGTVGFISPEQLRGRPADHRSDLFSFGAIFYEMLSGRRAFRGESAADTISSILREDPPELSTTNSTISPALERIVRHCLEKNPEERFHSASDFAFALEALSGSTTISSPTVSVPPLPSGRIRSRELIAWAVAAFFILATITLLVVRNNREPHRMVFASVLAPDKLSFDLYTGLALSPDGRRLAFIARTEEGKTLLCVRPLDGPTAQSLSGTEGASFPFWSPDSRFVAFFAQRKLKKIDPATGSVEALAEAPDGVGGTWNRDGVLLFAPDYRQVIHRVSAAGGAAVPITQLDKSRGEIGHRWPFFLPDGRRFLYLAGTTSSAKTEDTYVGSLDGEAPKPVVAANSNIAYVPAGYLLFWREGALRAQRFDASRFHLTGEAFSIALGVQFDPRRNLALFSVSENGVLAYQTGWSARFTALAWFDRQGKQIGSVGEPANYYGPRLSHDNRRVVVDMGDVQNNGDLWLYELSRPVTTRFTFDPADESAPLWSPDDSRIAYFSSKGNVNRDLYQRLVTGTSGEEILFASDAPKGPTDWSPDGRSIVFATDSPEFKSKRDLWILSVADRKATPFLATPFNEYDGQFSPDGRLIAYVSDESGREEIYVQPFVGSGSRLQISTAGGVMPKWRSNGKELFFIAPDNKLMVCDLSASGGFEAGVPKPLFETRIKGHLYRQYDVSTDGQRFLINTELEATTTSITLVLNWTANISQ